MTEPRYHFEISPPTSPERMAIEMGRQISHGNEEEEVKEDPPTPRRLSMMRRAMSAPQGISDSLDSQLSDFESEFAAGAPSYTSLAVGLSVRAADVKAAAVDDDAGEEDEDSGRLRRISGGSAGSLDEDDGEEEGEEEEEEEPEVVLVGPDSRDESPPGASREGGAAESRADVAVRRSITQWSDDSTKHEWDRFSRTRRMAKVAEEKQQPPMDRSVSFKQTSPTSKNSKSPFPVMHTPLLALHAWPKIETWLQKAETR